MKQVALYLRWRPLQLRQGINCRVCSSSSTIDSHAGWSQTPLIGCASIHLASVLARGTAENSAILLATRDRRHKIRFHAIRCRQRDCASQEHVPPHKLRRIDRRIRGRHRFHIFLGRRICRCRNTHSRFTKKEAIAAKAKITPSRAS